jgi:hypothetical protein
MTESAESDNVDFGQTMVNLGHHLKNLAKQLLMTLLIKSPHSCGQTLINPWSKSWSICLCTSSRTFIAFSKFHLNTSKSLNIKVIQFFKGHNFAFGWHFKFCVEKGEKLGQLQSGTIHQRHERHDFCQLFVLNLLIKA